MFREHLAEGVDRDDSDVMQVCRHWKL